MRLLELDRSSSRSSQLKSIFLYVIVIFSVLLGLLCLVGFIVTSIKWNLRSNLVSECKNDTQPIILCYARLLINNIHHTQWDRYIRISLLLSYASVFFHIIVETNRTNISGLIGQMIIQTISIAIGIGVSFPILFLPSYIYFYKSHSNSNKSPVPIDILYLGLVYVICIIIIPTYLTYFLSSNNSVVSIMSIVLLVSPLGFIFISLPTRLLSEFIQRCWIINSHRFVAYSQIILFTLSAPLFFIAFVSLITHWSGDLIRASYVTEPSNTVAIIWSIDYISLFIALLLFIYTNEYLSNDNSYCIKSSRLKKLITYFILTVVFIISPCLAFPLYIAWTEYQFVGIH